MTVTERASPQRSVRLAHLLTLLFGTTDWRWLGYV